jgi:hypothetical protein
MLVEGIQAALANNAQIQAQLGTAESRSDSTNGLFPIMAPEEVPVPYVVYQQVSGEPLQESYAGTGALQTSRWRFSCYGSTYKQAKTTAKVLRLVLIALNGPLPGTSTKTEVQGAWLKLEADDSEPIPHGTLYATHVDFEINFKDYDV